MNLKERAREAAVNYIHDNGALDGGRLANREGGDG